MKPRFLLAGVVSLLLITLVACGGPTSPTSGGTTPTASGPTTVQVALSDFKIQSSHTTFMTGTTYRFVVTNAGTVNHEFMVGPISAANASEEERDAAMLFEVADVAPGQTKTMEYTFTQPAAEGTLEFSCHEPGHYEQGMNLDFSVTT